MRSFEELNKQYKIRRRLYNGSTRLRKREPRESEFDVIVEPVRIKHAHAEYRVVKNAPGLSDAELATICAQGKSILGWGTRGDIIAIPIAIEIKRPRLCKHL